MSALDIKQMISRAFFSPDLGTVAKRDKSVIARLVRAIHELAILFDKSFLDSPIYSGNDRRKPFRNRLILVRFKSVDKIRDVFMEKRESNSGNYSIYD